MCACVRYLPERGVFLSASFSSEIGLVFLWMHECFGLPSGCVKSSIGEKISSDTLLT